MIIVINMIGLCLIGLVIWWFWLYTPKLYVHESSSMKDDNIIEILVKNGVYTPAYIQIEKNHPITLRFTREDASPCAEIVNFDLLGINRQLPLNESIDININIKKPGDYQFTCQMGMYRGTLAVK